MTPEDEAFLTQVHRNLDKEAIGPESPFFVHLEELRETYWAARSFSAVLDGAEHGETVVVTRGGRRVALIVPAPGGNGKAVSEVLDRWRGRLGVDEEFMAHVATAGNMPVKLDRDPWRE